MATKKHVTDKPKSPKTDKNTRGKIPISAAQQIKRNNISLLKEYAKEHNYTKMMEKALLQTLSKCVGHETIKTTACGKKRLSGAGANRKTMHRYHFRRLCVINYIVYRVDSEKLHCVPEIMYIRTEKKNHNKNKEVSKGVKKN